MPTRHAVSAQCVDVKTLGSPARTPGEYMMLTDVFQHRPLAYHVSSYRSAIVTPDMSTTLRLPAGQVVQPYRPLGSTGTGTQSFLAQEFVDCPMSVHVLNTHLNEYSTAGEEVMAYAY